jgi:hypothetical protein
LEERVTYATQSGQDPRWHDGTDTQARHDPVQQQEALDAELRNGVVNRIGQMNAMHAMHAWDRRRSRPIGPHALAFFYADEIVTGSSLRYEIKAGTRLFLDGDDVRGLPRLLYEMVGIGRDYLDKGVWNPLTTMCNRADEMSPYARYWGVGVSTLDTPVGDWAEVQARAMSVLDVPGRCFALGYDGARIIVDRSERVHGGSRIRSTHQLDSTPGMPSRMWSWLAEPAEPGTEDVWSWLNELHRVVVESQRRLSAAQQRRGVR